MVRALINTLIMNSPQAFIFIGRSGAGKGTQINLLLEYFKIAKPEQRILYSETGAFFRQFLSQNTYSSQRAKEKNLAGERGADFLAIYLWADFLTKNYEAGQTLICDGSPRSLNEAKAMDTAFKFYNFGKPKVIYLDVTVEECTARLKRRARPDDIAPGGIEKRLAWFESEVMPAVDYYRQSDFYEFIDIDGNQEEDKVRQEILSHL